MFKLPIVGFKDFCDELLSLSSSRIKKLKIKVNSVTNLPEVDCFVKEMEDFLEVSKKSIICHH